MKSNSHGALHPPFDCNLTTKMWAQLVTIVIVAHKLLKFLKLVEIAIVTVVGNVEDEKTFSIINFMKSTFFNCLATHLDLVVQMYVQKFSLLKILSFATSHYATSMQLVVVCNYFGHVCNYKFGIV
jgi:hypothetical protein